MSFWQAIRTCSACAQRRRKIAAALAWRKQNESQRSYLDNGADRGHDPGRVRAVDTLTATEVESSTHGTAAALTTPGGGFGGGVGS
jgi:hypothetical protein